jgi:hypothetical protein
VKKVFLIASLIILGCTKEAPEKIPPPPDEIQVPIGFGAGIINTKAPIESVSGVPSTQIDGIQILRQDVHKNSSPTWSTVSSVTATASFFTNGNFIVNPLQYHNSNQNKYSHFTAYYPGVNENSVATALSNGVATFTITGQEDIISAPSATAQGSSSSIPVALTFSHKLSQLQIYIKADNEGAIAAWGDITAVKATSPTVLTLNITSQTLAENGTPLDLSTGESPQALTTSFASFGTILVYPGTLTIKVTSANVPEQTVTITGLSSTTAGHAHRIDLTFTATAINFSATLTDWVNGTTGSGTVE